MSRHHLSPEAQIELLRRQYLQLIDPVQLSVPADHVLKQPEIQTRIYNTMFRTDCLAHPPSERYRGRVLKRLLEGIEHGVTDPEEDEISDDLTAAFAALVVVPKAAPEVVAQQWNYVTYTLPRSLEPPPDGSPPVADQITLLESQNVIASQGTTGRRTWEAALHLSTLLLSEKWSSRLAGKTIIELGAGTGLLSILAAKHLRAKHVLATDGSAEVVQNLEPNFQLNGLDDIGQVRAAVLKWGENLDKVLLDGDAGEARSYDFLIGSDLVGYLSLIYDRDAVPPLVMTISQLFSQRRDMQVLISATVRNEATLDLFETTCGKEGMKIERLSVPPQDSRTQTGLFHSISMPIRVYFITKASA